MIARNGRQKAWLLHCVKTVCSNHNYTGDKLKKGSTQDVASLKWTAEPRRATSDVSACRKIHFPAPSFNMINESLISTAVHWTIHMHPGSEYIGISVIAALLAGTQWGLCRDKLQALDTVRTFCHTVPESTSSHTFHRAVPYYVTSPSNSLRQGCQNRLYATVHRIHVYWTNNMPWNFKLVAVFK